MKLQILTLMFFLLSSYFAIADEESDKANFKKLYAEFNDLYSSSASFDPILTSATKLHDMAPRLYGKNSKEHATVTYNLAKVFDLIANQIETFSMNKKMFKMYAAKHYEAYFDILGKLKTPKDIVYVRQYFDFVLARIFGSFEKSRTSRNKSSMGYIIYNAKYPRRLISFAEDIKLPENEIADIEFAVALAIINIGRYDEGQKYLKPSLERNIKLYGESHFKIGQNLFWQAKLDAAKGRNEAAEERYLKALNIFENNPNEGKELIEYTHAFLVALYEEMEEHEKATIHSQAIAVERPDDFDRKLIPLYKKQPKYNGYYMGDVEVEFTVDKEGKTKDIKVISSAEKSLGRHVVDAVSQWRFAPTIKNGEYVETHGVQVVYQFVP